MPRDILEKELEGRIPTSEEIQKHNIHRVYPAPLEEDEKNKAIAPALRRLDTVANVMVIPSGSILAEYMETPFMKPPLGKIIWGVESIQNYVAQFFN